MSKRFAPPRASVNIHQLVAAIALSVCTGVSPGAFAEDGIGPDKTPIGVPPSAMKPDKALEMFADNLSYLAQQGKAPIFLGELELQRTIIEILDQEKPGTAYILGPKGAGKTTMVEYLAGQLPGREIWSLRVNDLEADTAYRGSLEGRLKAFFEAFIKDPKRVLYIDEFHQIMQLKGVADTLKPLMSKRLITVLASTTEDEFGKFVAGKDAALADRAPIFRMEEHKFEKVLNILREKAPSFEKQYGIYASDDALVRAVKLTFLYYDGSPSRTAERILERSLARKASLRDENKLPFASLKPTEEIGVLKKNIVRFEAELERKKGIMDTAVLERQIEDAQAKLKVHEEKLQEVQAYRMRDEMNEKFVQYARQVRDMEKEIAKGQASEDLYRQLGEAKSMRDKLQDALAKMGNGGPPLNDPNELSARDVGSMVAKDIGITEESANETDAQKLARLKTKLQENLFNQDHVIDTVVEQIGIRLANLEPVEKPIVLMVVGPPGVGKSTFEEILGEFWFGDKSRIVGIEMNSQGVGGSWDFWGPAAGFVDSEEGSKFEPVRRRPFSLISLREFDKVRHGSIYDNLLQAFGKGEQADSRGRIINFRNTIVILDGNLTNRYSILRDAGYSAKDIESEFRLAPGTLEGMGREQMDQTMIKIELDKLGMSEAFQDRIDAKLMFNSTTRETAKLVMRDKLKKQIKKIYDEHRVTVDFGNLSGQYAEGEAPNVGDVIVDHYFNPNESARFYDRMRKTLLTSRLKDIILAYTFPPNSTIKVEFKPNDKAAEGEPAGEFQFTVKKHDREGKGADVVLKETFSKTHDGARIFMNAVDKPALSIGRSAGAAGHAADEETGRGEGRERGERGNRISQFRRTKPKAR